MSPEDPAVHGGGWLGGDAELEEAGYATGLDVWYCVDKAYTDFLGGDGELANAQLWSLRQAIRAEHLRELTHAEVQAQGSS